MTKTGHLGLHRR